jgi:hypothetical protein
MARAGATDRLSAHERAALGGPADRASDALAAPR